MGDRGSAAPDGPGRVGPGASAAERAGKVRLVCFVLSGQEYAAEIGDVVETMTVRPVSRVFLTPPWVAGIMNLRGDVVAVLDLARLLGLPPIAVTEDSRIVLTRHGGMRAGLLVDGLAELRTVEIAHLEPVPATLAPEAARFLAGIVTVPGGEVVRVLDLAALFESDRLRRLDGTRN
jgi:purine-binding chemotaxis protein CheW